MLALTEEARMGVLSSTAANSESGNGHRGRDEPWPAERLRRPHKSVQAYVDEAEDEHLEIGQSQLR